MSVWGYFIAAGVAAAVALAALAVECWLLWRARVARRMRAVSFSSFVRVGSGDGNECIQLLLE